LIFFLLPTTARAKLIAFPDFPWGSFSADVETAAGRMGWKLQDKTFDTDRRELAYRTVLREKECRVTFRFTPTSGQLFSVRAEWEGIGFGCLLREQFQKDYGTPREEMPRLKIYIWSRQNTEVELRHGDETTILIYSDLNLWSEYTEEMKRLREMKRAQDQE